MVSSFLQDEFYVEHKDEFNFIEGMKVAEGKITGFNIVCRGYKTISQIEQEWTIEDRRLFYYSEYSSDFIEVEFDKQVGVITNKSKMSLINSRIERI